MKKPFWVGFVPGNINQNHEAWAVEQVSGTLEECERFIEEYNHEYADCTGSGLMLFESDVHDMRTDVTVPELIVSMN